MTSHLERSEGTRVGEERNSEAGRSLTSDLPHQHDGGEQHDAEKQRYIEREIGLRLGSRTRANHAGGRHDARSLPLGAVGDGRAIERAKIEIVTCAPHMRAVGALPIVDAHRDAAHDYSFNRAVVLTARTALWDRSIRRGRSPVRRHGRTP
jgi:hypothetical protein